MSDEFREGLDDEEQIETESQVLDDNLLALVRSQGPAEEGIVPSEFGIIPSFWGLDQAALEGVRRARAIQNTRHGLLAAVPMICKDHACPFATTCYIPAHQRKAGSRCPIEIAAIIDRFEKYCSALSVDPEKDVVDMGLIKELVDIEVQMLRADNKMAMQGDFEELVVATVDNKGNPYYKSELTKATQFKSDLRKERHRILNLLNSTRKDREAGKPVGTQDQSVLAATLMAKAAELERQGKLRRVIEITEPLDPEPQGEGDS